MGGVVFDWEGVALFDSAQNIDYYAVLQTLRHFARFFFCISTKILEHSNSTADKDEIFEKQKGG